MGDAARYRRGRRRPRTGLRIPSPRPKPQNASLQDEARDVVPDTEPDTVTPEATPTRPAVLKAEVLATLRVRAPLRSHGLAALGTGLGLVIVDFAVGWMLVVQNSNAAPDWTPSPILVALSGIGLIAALFVAVQGLMMTMAARKFDNRLKSLTTRVSEITEGAYFSQELDRLLRRLARRGVLYEPTRGNAI
jgi:hypothetical protein